MNLTEILIYFNGVSCNAKLILFSHKNKYPPTSESYVSHLKYGKKKFLDMRFTRIMT